jgi:hypothetical protein
MRAALVLLACAAPAVATALPSATVHSGRLLDSAGAPIHGAHDLTVRLWPASGAAVWERTFADVAFEDGYYTVELGSDGSLGPALLLGGPLYLGLEVDGGGELPVRTALGAVPYATLAGGVRLGDVDLPCAAGIEGTLRVRDGSVQVCLGTSWSPVGGTPTGTAATPARSCRQLHADWPSFPSDVYYVDPNGGSPNDAIPVYCEMSAADGGWTRVGTADGVISICELTAALGTPAAISTSTGTAWLAPATVEALIEDDEVLIASSATVWTRYRSDDPAFTWTAVADGRVGTNTNTDYGVLYQRHTDSGFSALPEGSCSAINGADCLMGGYVGGQWTHLLGIGSHRADGAHDQATCQASTGSWRGMLYGTSWGRAGEVYVR